MFIDMIKEGVFGKAITGFSWPASWGSPKFPLNTGSVPHPVDRKAAQSAQTGPPTPNRTRRKERYHMLTISNREYHTWPCSASPTGEHQHIEGDPHRPSAVRSWPDWLIEISEAAAEPGLSAGTYVVDPWMDGDMVRLDLIDPLVVCR